MENIDTEIKVGTGVTELLYTDSLPWEVVRVISDKTLEIRPMKAELNPNWKPEWVAGGFSAHCTNNGSQEWILSSNPDAGTIRIRKMKNRKNWTHNGRRFSVGKAVMYHDYNF